MNREEWELEQEKRKLLQDMVVTEYKKNKFIDEIKNGLGGEIIKQKKDQSKKLSLWVKIKKLLGWS
jgi:hypothetical protein